MAEREAHGPYANLDDLAWRLDGRLVNKRQLENLARAGALDSLNANRKQTVAAVDLLLRQANAAVSERESGQMGLFAEAAAPVPVIQLPEVDDWSPVERLREEFGAIGAYLSAHPLDAHAGSLQRMRARRFLDILAEGRSGSVNLAGTIVSKKERTSSKGGRFAFVQLSDTSGLFEVTVFSELLAASRGSLEVGNSLFVKANAQFEGEGIRLTALSLEPLDQVAARARRGLRVVVDSAAPLAPLQALLAGGNRSEEGNGARGPVMVVSRLDAATEVEIGLPDRYAISPKLLQAVKGIPGVLEVQDI